MYEKSYNFGLYYDYGVRIEQYYNDSIGEWIYTSDAITNELRREYSPIGYDYWIALLKDGIETGRSNIKYCSWIEWNKDDVITMDLLISKKETK